MKKEQGSVVGAKIHVLEDFEKFDHSLVYNWCEQQLIDNIIFSDIHGGRSNSDVSDVFDGDSRSDNKNVAQLSEIARVSTIGQMDDNDNISIIVQWIFMKFMYHIR